MKWKLTYKKHELDEVWLVLQESCPSGDRAKVVAHHHAAGRGVYIRYCIFDPAGNAWKYGRPSMYSRGLKMVWSDKSEK